MTAVSPEKGGFGYCPTQACRWHKVLLELVWQERSQPCHAMALPRSDEHPGAAGAPIVLHHQRFATPGADSTCTLVPPHKLMAFA